MFSHNIKPVYKCKIFKNSKKLGNASGVLICNNYYNNNPVSAGIGDI